MNRFLYDALKAINKITSLGGKVPHYIVKFIRFSVSSATTLLLDFLILIILVEFFEIYYLTSAAVAFTSSNSLNYLINRVWGFPETKRKPAEGYIIFITFGLFGLALTVFLMWIFVDKINLFYFIARILVAMIEGTISFILHYFITFKIPKKTNVLPH